MTASSFARLPPSAAASACRENTTLGADLHANLPVASPRFALESELLQLAWKRKMTGSIRLLVARQLHVSNSAPLDRPACHSRRFVGAGVLVLRRRGICLADAARDSDRLAHAATNWQHGPFSTANGPRGAALAEQPGCLRPRRRVHGLCGHLPLDANVLSHRLLRLAVVPDQHRRHHPDPRRLFLLDPPADAPAAAVPPLSPHAPPLAQPLALGRLRLQPLGSLRPGRHRPARRFHAADPPAGLLDLHALANLLQRPG